MREKWNPLIVETGDRDFLRRFGESLRRIRLERGLTQDQVAERAGITNKYLSELENGKRSLRLLCAQRIASALGKKLDDLIESAIPGRSLKDYAIQPPLDDLVRRLDTAEQKKAYGILKAAFKD